VAIGFIPAFRLPSWKPGYYMATASFLLLNQTVRTELLHSSDHGLFRRGPSAIMPSVFSFIWRIHIE
jgi:hypothetical protein